MRRIIALLLPLLLILCGFEKNFRVTITGSIRDESGNAIPSAGVQEIGKRNQVMANEKGVYSIVVEGNQSSLRFTAAGFAPLTVKAGKRQLIDVVLKASSSVLEEVVVTADGAPVPSKKVRHETLPLPRVMTGVPGIATTGYANTGTPVYNTEDYDGISENSFHRATDQPLSTFSIDVDAASYSNVRRFLNGDELPPQGSVRIEEMINYFRYNYPAPKEQHPFSINTEYSDCPWNVQHKIVLIGLQGKKIPAETLPPSNLVFLIDVSGSMSGANRLPLVKSSLKLLVDQLREKDRISIVVYAGAAGLVLPPTAGSEKIRIKTAIDELASGGSTAGGAGIMRAYAEARKNFMKGGNNRVILCTDGDFNVGVSSDAELEKIVESERSSGIYLTVLGYGMGNYKDNKLQKLADKGNGNHAYIDGLSEAKKVLVSEFGGTLFTIAQDVKLQVEFNPARVAGYRLIGYENRLLQAQEFNDDKKDAGELGSGHTVTALYEIIPAGTSSTFLKETDALKYTPKAPLPATPSAELLTVKFRYKTPGKDVSQLIVHSLQDRYTTLAGTSNNYRLAVSVAGFGLLLRKSEFRGTATYGDVLRLATSAQSDDAEGYRKELVQLIKKAAMLSGADTTAGALSQRAEGPGKPRATGN
jgi:Ca-activated chloride channel family protein